MDKTENGKHPPHLGNISLEQITFQLEMLLFSFHYVIFAWNYHQSNSDNRMGNKYQIPYTNACIRAFAKRFKLSVKIAFEYLYAFKGIDFLVEFYEIEHLQSIDDAVDDLIVYCANNGGTLK